jgi:hypothetical protein
MSFSKDGGRKSPVIADITISYADLVSGTAKEVIDIPAGAIIDDVHAYVDTAWNSGSSDVITVGDGGDVDRFITSVSIAATGNKIGVTTAKGYKYTTKDTIDVIWTGVSTAPSAGSLRLIVEYHFANKADYAVTPGSSVSQTMT